MTSRDQLGRLGVGVEDGGGFPRFDPDENQVILVVGTKGSGKSVWARSVFRDWGGVDRLVIDPTGDADPGADLGTIEFKGRPPTELPIPEKRGEWITARYVPDMRSPSFAEDMDRALGAALFPKTRPRLVWVDEAEEMFPSRPGPNARMALRQGRHQWTSLILCTPRPVWLDLRCVQQADFLVIYDVTSPSDVERLASRMSVDWTPRKLAAAVSYMQAEGKYWYLLYSTREHQMYVCPPVPLDPGYQRAQA